MTPTAQGRFCAACQHTVTDFTQRTDAEVLAILRQAAGGRVCGRFRAEQLNRELVHAPVAAPRWRAWLLTVAALWGVPAAAQQLRGGYSGGPTPTGSRPATQQLPGAALTESERAGTSPDSSRVLLGEPVAARPVGIVEAPTMRYITGRVIDQKTQEGLPGATIVIQGTSTGCSTNADGSFTMAAYLPSNAGLRIASIGYETETRSLPADGQPLTVAMHSDTTTVNQRIILGGAVSIIHFYPWYSPKGIWYRLAALPRRLTGRW